MIIKSMSRKAATFDQLIDYITTGQIDERYNVYQNVFSRHYDKLKREFEHNAQNLTRRKNGVYLYHEILSITRAKDISEKRQKEIFCQLAQEYAQGRAGQNMMFAGMHDDKNHNLHYHFVISANGVNEAKRFRLSKAEFAKFKQDFEKMALEKYPELEQKVIIQRTSSEKLSNKGGELKRRTGKTPQREKVIEMLRSVFEKSFSHDDLIRGLDEKGYDFYIRGKNPGVCERSTGRKYRLKTLGMIDQLESLDDSISKETTKEKTQVKKRPAGEKEKAADTASVDSETTQQESDSVNSKKRSASSPKLDERELAARKRKAQIKSERQARSESEQDDNDKQKRWVGGRRVPDFLSMFDAFMNVFSVAKAAGEVDESESGSAKKKKIEPIWEHQATHKSAN